MHAQRNEHLVVESRKLAAGWIQDDYLLAFLDGLDEIEPILRAHCVTAINKFVEESNLRPLR